MEVWIVLVDSYRFFDPCQYSYLPTMHKVFGIYRSKMEALDNVWNYFGDNEKYEYLTDGELSEYENGETIFGDDFFLYKDKQYEGYAIYAIEYFVENLPEQQENER